MSGKFTVNAGWTHAPHLSEEQKREELARIQPFQRKARSRRNSEPGCRRDLSGAGRIDPVRTVRYPRLFSAILCNGRRLEPHARCCGAPVTQTPISSISTASIIVARLTRLFMHCHPFTRGLDTRRDRSGGTGPRAARRSAAFEEGTQELGLETLAVAENALEAASCRISTQIKLAD